MRLLGWVTRHLRSRSPAGPGAQAVVGYLAWSRLPGFGGGLDGRTSLLAAGLAAELSGCRWCIDRVGHDGRLAGLPGELFRDLSAYSSSHLFSERERAALAFVESVAGAGDSSASTLVLRRAREFLAERELAELTAIVAEHHCLESLHFNHPDR